eukprot:1158706-Pelagomonas_calceolata.AAC.7
MKTATRFAFKEKTSALHAEGPQCAVSCQSAPALACLFFCLSLSMLCAAVCSRLMSAVLI